MLRVAFIPALLVALSAAAATAQGPYPAPPGGGAAPGSAMHRSGAAASADGTTGATLAPARRARGDCALDGLAAACGVSPGIAASN